MTDVEQSVTLTNIPEVKAQQVLRLQTNGFVNPSTLAPAWDAQAPSEKATTVTASETLRRLRAMVQMMMLFVSKKRFCHILLFQELLLVDATECCATDGRWVGMCCDTETATLKILHQN